MNASIKVRIDRRVVVVCFASREDAERFRAFTDLYHVESGERFADEAYLNYGYAMSLTHGRPPWATATLERGRLLHMMGKILEGRLAAAAPDLAPYLERLGDNGPDGVIFPLSAADLPPRQRPAVGDMCRGLTPDAGFRIGSEGGIVVADHGDVLEVVSAWEIGFDGRCRDDALRHRVAAGEVMKIRNWLTK